MDESYKNRGLVLVELTGSYNGYKIGCSSGMEGRFWAEVGSSNIGANTLEKLKTKIDGIERKNFNRVKVLKIVSVFPTAKFIKCEVTSHAGDGDAWVISEKGIRSKESADRLIVDNDDTASKIEAIKGFEVIVKKFRNERDAILSSLERYEIKEVKC